MKGLAVVRWDDSPNTQSLGHLKTWLVVAWEGSGDVVLLEKVTLGAVLRFQKPLSIPRTFSRLPLHGLGCELIPTMTVMDSYPSGTVRPKWTVRSSTSCLSQALCFITETKKVTNIGLKLFPWFLLYLNSYSRLHPEKKQRLLKLSKRCFQQNNTWMHTWRQR